MRAELKKCLFAPQARTFAALVCGVIVIEPRVDNGRLFGGRINNERAHGAWQNDGWTAPDAFARLMNEKLENANINTRKGYIRSIIDAIDVDDKAIRIIGSRDILQAAIAGKQIKNRNVSGFVRSGRAARYPEHAIVNMRPISKDG